MLLRDHLRRERDPKLRRKKLADAKHRGVPIECEACGFDLARTYGGRGHDYIECHHRTPLHVTGETVTRLSDLAPDLLELSSSDPQVQPWLPVEALRDLVAANRRPRT